MTEIYQNLKILDMTFLKRKCMHKNCLFDKAAGLSTIFEECSVLFLGQYLCPS